ncbi:hypothetical protein ACSS7Z_12175 [Microbacterium sp. A82]|uniref:hypothetical protein n=1 Tax=unclassified Microbacterium TaxID=2609290 RepID=UPI003F30CAEB
MTDPQFPPPVPHGSVPPVPPAPGYPAAPAPGYAAPAYQQPYATPPGAFAAPVGGYSAPSSGYQAPQPTPPQSPLLGVIAVVLSSIAAVVAPILAGTAGYQIGAGLPSIMIDIDSADEDLSFLSPVRDQVLWGEIGFWIGTLAGIAAIVLGIIAIIQQKGRGWGIAAVIVSVIAPVIFFIVLFIALSAGAAAGAVSLYGT